MSAAGDKPAEQGAKGKNTRDALIHAGIDEINAHGVADFSVRRVAEVCGVSCAAPYKHFKDKRDFIAAILTHVHGEWRDRQKKVMEEAGGSLRAQLTAISVEYVKFLVERPYYWSILVLRDAKFDQIYLRLRGHINSRSQKLLAKYFAESGLDEQTMARKLYAVRAMILGAVVMFENGEQEYNDQALENIRYNIDREFDLP